MHYALSIAYYRVVTNFNLSMYALKASLQPSQKNKSINIQFNRLIGVKFYAI